MRADVSLPMADAPKIGSNAHINAIVATNGADHRTLRLDRDGE
jgi:hypothetical protein